ncbi:MAG: peroxide-responsive transcriptional repressor PerR [Anaerolineales bacterium]
MMSELPQLTVLRRRGFRITPQRTAILTVLTQAQSHLAPGEIFDRTRAHLPGITSPTVYRTLEFLAAQGVVLRTLMHGDVVYELAVPHHHLICRACGAMVDVAHEALSTLYERLQRETGYVLDDSHLVLTGLCPACQQHTALHPEVVP